MPATLVRPSPLHLCAHEAEEDSKSWSPSSSDSEAEDECNSANSDNSDEMPSSAPVQRLIRTGPALQTRPRLPSPPRTSPLSPLACGSSSTESAAAFPFPAAGRPRPRGLSPLSPVAATGGLQRGAMPKATPLARTLLNRSLSGGASSAAPKKPTKMIVPTKPFRTTFDLGLTSKELARRP
ncbi:uncharacterized protein EHS24_007033 [Apiotrichum porosum]|uniref:Uncharacterized protein n=1 Tax=Apiotrichum porosum TaxID=105984 RepID=A0A427XXA2_9TREE|nr:uncharacterized protein EHS24_007033 [Apiotrichum porosum]RSH83355.1 hypothetical protein EHS24_007033 [Apiotrichum porosum]